MAGSDDREGKESLPPLITPSPPSVPPVMGISSEFELNSSIDDIRAFDQEFWEVTKGLPIRTGSVVRVPSSYYHRWGIRITDENRQELVEMADSVREKDRMEREDNQELQWMGKTELSNAIRSRMAGHIGYLVREIVKEVDDGERTFRICDLAAGNGLAAVSIASSITMDDETAGTIGRMTFDLIDYSGARLDSARKNLERFKPGDIRQHVSNDRLFLEETGVKFDFVTSLCHFHKKPFTRYLKAIHNVLRDDGALVSGDWHSSMCTHPLYVYQLFERMNFESKRLDRFRALFGSLLSPISEREVLQEEIQAMRDHADHWVEVWRRLPELLQRSPREPRLYVLGAFDTSRERVKKFEENGFTVDAEKIRTAFPKARIQKPITRMLSGSDHAAVMLCIKK